MDNHRKIIAVCGCIIPGARTRDELVNELSDSYFDQKKHIVAMNNMLFNAAEKEHLQDVAGLCEFAVGLWMKVKKHQGKNIQLLPALARKVL